MRRSQVFAGLLLAAMAATAAAQGAARKPYIVQLADAPVVTYNGGVAGYTATRPAAGTRLDVNASHVQAYTAYLEQKQSSVIAATVPNSQVIYRYKNLINGFAAMLTEAEYAKMLSTPGVSAVQLDVPMQQQTSTTPTFIGVRGPGGAWSRTDAQGRAVKGEDVIIGALDGGVWPENPSFSDKVDANGVPVASHLPGTQVYGPPPAQWQGVCQAGQGFNASHCNNKLIGARFFNSTWKQVEASGGLRTWSREYLDSPRDPGGHGTHVLSTAGGNENVPVTIAGSPFVVSGIAPRARVVAYKVCFINADANDVPNPNGGSCFQGDSAAAADRAVLDGADVLNFSVGGSSTSFTGIVDTAFANATFAGVFVAVAAGNSGPTAGSVAHINPWVMTVGNSTHDRLTAANVTLGNGQVFTGASFQTTGLATLPLIRSTDAGLPGANATNLRLCFGPADGVAPVLDPAKVAGKILVCDRGSNALVFKTENARTAGAAGAIIVNVPGGGTTLLDLPHVIPTVHLPSSAFTAVTTYTSTTGATASFSAGTSVAGVIAPVMNDGSSRGPNRADANLLKPDITAPGTNIMAAYTNTTITPAQRAEIIAGTLIPGPGADMISGTSMASPHVAGAAALMKQVRPTWSPYAIKSALMTSASQNVKLANGAADTNRFGQGAGHLNPTAAIDTNLVYDQSAFDHIDYYFRAINGRQINVASLTHANVVGVGSLTRTITNKGTSSVTLSGSASLAGFTTSLSPSSLTIPAGGSASYTLTMTRTAAAPIETYQFGTVTWTDGGANTLRSPVTAKPSLFVGLSEVSDTRNVGTKVYTVGFGYAGALLTSAIGLSPATTKTDRISTGQTQCMDVSVTAGAKFLRAQLFNADTEGGAASDIDLIVLRNGSVVGSSLRGDSEETVQLNNPTAGTYQVCADGFAPINNSAGYRMFAWVVGPTNPGTLRAFGPSSVVIGGVASIGASWNVPAGQRYLGLIEFRQTAGGTPIGSTTVYVKNQPDLYPPASSQARVESDKTQAMAAGGQ